MITVPIQITEYAPGKINVHCEGSFGGTQLEEEWAERILLAVHASADAGIKNKTEHHFISVRRAKKG